MNHYDCDYDYVGTICKELLNSVSQSSANAPTDLCVEQTLERLFGSYNWASSFERTQILVYDEYLSSELLVSIHRWLRKKCADIENIQLITTHFTGVANWWKDWCKTHHERSFSIREVFYTNRPLLTHSMRLFYQEPNFLLRDKKFFLEQKHISKLFSYYGGSWSNVERQYLMLKFAKFSHIAEIDFLAKLCPLNDILDYAENITYYKNQTEINQLADTYARLNNQEIVLLSHKTVGAKRNEEINFNGLQWDTDRHCWATVIRETLNSDKFSCVTEKTIRTFLYHCVAIPLGYKAVSDLENLGFWFPHDMIDYSYQNEDLFAARINKLVESLDLLSTKSFDDLQKYYVDNIDKFQYNAELVYKIHATHPNLRF